LIRDGIITKDFVSFTDGFPYDPEFGDSSIVFDKQKVIANNDAYRVEYTEEEIFGNMELQDYLFEKKTFEELVEYIISLRKKRISEITPHLVKMTPTDKKRHQTEIKELKKEIEGLESNPKEKILNYLKIEKNIICPSPFIFKETDVVGIVYSSVFFEQCFPCPEKYNKKIEYWDYYHPRNYCVIGSHLENEMAPYEMLISKLDPSSNDHDIYRLHFLTMVLVCMPVLKQYAIPSFNRYSIPPKWMKVVQHIDKIKDKDFKIEVINFIFRKYRLGRNPQHEHEEELMKKCLSLI